VLIKRIVLGLEAALVVGLAWTEEASVSQSDTVQETSWRAMATMENWSREEFRSV